MNGMDGNNHYNGSLQFSGWARNVRKPTDADLTPEAAAFREYALTQATLALAYEQRTANLIATLRVGAVDMTDWPQQVIDNFHRTSIEISQRMGIEGATK